MLSLAFAQAAAPIVSEASNIPYLPTAIWVLVVSMSLVVVLVTLAIYRWYDMRVKAVVEDGATVADLVAQKTGLEAKLEDDRKWLKECKDELLSVQAERQEQQQLRQELAGLSMEAAQYEQKIDGLRQVESGLQNVVSTLGQDRDRLTAEKDTLDKSIEKLETAKRVAETDQQRAETEAKRAEQEFQSIAGRYQEEKDRLDSLVQDIAGKEVQQQGLNREIASTTERCFLLRDELLKLEAERREQEILRKELETMQGEVTQHEQRVGDLRSTASELQNAISTFTQNRDHLLQDQERLTAEKTTLEQAKADAEAVASAAAESQRRAVAEAERARQEMQEVTRNLGDLLRDISEREIKQQTLIHESIALSARLSDLQKEMLTTEERLARVRDDLAPLEEIFAQKKQAQRERDELLEERRTLQEAVGSLKRERASLEGIEAVSRYADLLEMPPECLADDRFSGGELEERDEAEALFELQENLREQGLFFADRILKAFHTSLKVNQINPLTVLAGVSGTGKSRLPIEYAQAMGMHSLIVSVQPRWDSPQDLFGFYNYLEHKYKATDLARALIRMDPFNFDPRDFPSLKGQKRYERILLILLDEMNLARIEYYFSEFLSKLEFRRLLRQRALAEFELETGPRSSEENPFRLWVGENVLFVGTMNEDESTQTLSDKVLDRANVLRFGRPPEVTPKHSDKAPQNKRFLTLSGWQSWIKSQSSAGNPWDSDVHRWITTVNTALEQIGRPFGYRVQEAIRAYIMNYPGVERGQTYKIAFADQIEQKVLPKLRGIDMSENASSEALDGVRRVIDELGDDDLSGTFQKCIDDTAAGAFLFRGVTRSV